MNDMPNVEIFLSPSNLNFDKRSTIFLEMLPYGLSGLKACSNTRIWGEAINR